MGNRAAMVAARSRAARYAGAMDARIERLLGIARSLRMYYGTPWRAARRRALYGRFMGPGDLCFDVGAHVGNRVACWRRLGARVVALEPQPDFAALLRRLFRRDVAVTVIQAAVGERPGRLRLLASARTPTVSTLSEHWAERVGATASFAGVQWAPGPEVEVTTLDALIAQHGEPAFVKIDVEGFEPQVLAGLSRPLRALSFEVLPATRELGLACIDRLQALADYRYAWSPGESMRLDAAGWCDAAAMRARLAALREADGSGDVYALRAGG